MKSHVSKTNERQSQTTHANNSGKAVSADSAFQFADNRAESAENKLLNTLANNSPDSQQAAQLQAMTSLPVQKAELEDEDLLQGKFQTVQLMEDEEELLQGKFQPVQLMEDEELLQGKFEPVQKKENKTGLPMQLKTGIENLSGQSLDDVKVNFNSGKPAQLNAHAYAQGTDIHLGPGQEKHLPHEAWHVVQQKQGRVKPTMQMKGHVPVNDDAGLEKEADVMGEKAVAQGISIAGEAPFQMKPNKKQAIKNAKKNNPNGIQHHLRPEYQRQNEQQMNLVMSGMSRKEAKRQVKQKTKKK